VVVGGVAESKPGSQSEERSSERVHGKPHRARRRKGTWSHDQYADRRQERRSRSGSPHKAVRTL
jgi:hypothetical protein